MTQLDEKISVYKCIEIWSAYEKEEKFFYYNSKEEMCVVGAVHASQNDESPFVFYAIPFFYSNEHYSVDDLSKLGITFRDYLVTKKNVIVKKNVSDTLRIKPIKKSKHRYNIVPSDLKNWSELFSIVKENIKSGVVNKVVGSRCVDVICEESVNVDSILMQLIENNPSSYIFAYSKEGKVFLGATPEILVERKGSSIKSYALAGTLAKNKENENSKGEWLKLDKKNNLEYQIVVQTIANKMKAISRSVDISDTRVLELKNLFHLKTEIVAECGNLTLIEWVKVLHPTPAVGGEPMETALEILKKVERYDRGYFSGPIGFVEKNGDGIFLVGIRSALIDKSKIRIYAGCGIVKQSNCMEEFDETDKKMKTIIECL